MSTWEVRGRRGVSGACEGMAKGGVREDMRGQQSSRRRGWVSCVAAVVGRGGCRVWGRGKWPMGLSRGQGGR
eukprot:2056138-Rhodomonas_salina.2